MQEDWKRRKLSTDPTRLPPWSWLYLYPAKWRQGGRPKLCSWCGTMMLAVGPQNYRGRPWVCSVCDEPNTRQSRQLWRAFDQTAPEE